MEESTGSEYTLIFTDVSLADLAFHEGAFDCVEGFAVQIVARASRRDEIDEILVEKNAHANPGIPLGMKYW